MKKFVLTLLVSSIVLSGCNSQKVANLENENKTLKDKISVLEIENSKLKESAEFHYKTGIDYLNSANWPQAITEFNEVIQKFPQSALVANAQNGYAKANANILAEEKARKIAEVKEKRAKEESERLAGTPMDYATFYAKANGGGLPVGKRYKFSACVYRGTLCIDLAEDNFDKHECRTIADFDSTRTLENFRAAPGRCGCGTITASMGYEGRVHIHRINGQ